MIEEKPFVRIVVEDSAVEVAGRLSVEEQGSAVDRDREIVRKTAASGAKTEAESATAPG